MTRYAMSDLERRKALKLLAAAAIAPLTACSVDPAPGSGDAASPRSASGRAPAQGRDAIVAVTKMGARWETSDPFLFCAHHDDRYPAGNEQLGPAASLEGRRIGQDFEGKDGWRMYHGATVPGFPKHPHRGFETVTVVRAGRLDHSDSLGATARYGDGDVQWLTAGRGINHAEMFPLLRRGDDNPLELFQIWLNLPRANKMVDPHFTMMWNHTIPRHTNRDDDGRSTTLTVVAGRHGATPPPAPPPDSWAARADSDVAIVTIAMEANARFELPAAQRGSERSLYFFRGSGLRIGGREIPDYHRVEVRGDVAVSLEAGESATEILVLQGRPIGEPVARRGPFVMNTDDEIRQAYADYRRTGFGGWPWAGHDPVHSADAGRFARRADGSVDRPV